MLANGPHQRWGADHVAWRPGSLVGVSIRLMPCGQCLDCGRDALRATLMTLNQLL